MEEKRLFSKKHIWVFQNGNTAKIGITDFAQKKLGSIMFLNLPDIGEKLSIGQRFGDIESIKTVSDLISPLNGEVTGVNEDFLDEPDVINEKPYESWLIEARIVLLSDDLMDEETYLKCKDEL